MVKTIVKRTKVRSRSEQHRPSRSPVSDSVGLDKGSRKQQLNRDKFRQCSRLMKLTKRVWDEGFFSTQDRNSYRECFSYNMNYAFTWNGKRWILDPAKVLLSKRIPKFRPKDISVESNEFEVFFRIDKMEITNDSSGGYAIFIDDNMEEVLIVEIHRLGDNLFTTLIPSYFKAKYFYLHLSLYRSFCVDDVTSREVYDSVFLGNFKGLK
ncbi:hypothetical protein OAT16_01230 [Prolixibacteraceae bacterium]|nr:hypothetical protein [Prolixibacteraceae bacterium]